MKDKVKQLIEEANIAKDKSNRDKRVAYCNIELLRLDLETAGRDGVLPESEVTAMCTQLDSALPPLSFHCVNRPRQLYDFVDKFTRLSAAVIVLVYFGWFSVLCVMLQPVDEFLVKMGIINTYQKFNVYMRRLVGFLVVGTSGIELITQGSFDNLITNVVCFSHSSTLDAFTGAAALAAPSLAVSKKELFLIPFFAWMMAAWGSIPVNRNNRSSAVQSLETAEAAAGKGDCVMIAPEGTRSATGQLAPFKKGPFYLWEAMGRVPIVPLVIYGAYELYPPGSVFNSCGKVYCIFLPPLSASETADREVASRSLRRKMLTHMVTQAPTDAGENISWGQRLYTLILVLGAHAFNVAVLMRIYRDHVELAGAEATAPLVERLVQLVLNWLWVTGKVSLLAVAITLVMFVYTTVIKVAVFKMLRNKKPKSNKSD